MPDLVVTGIDRENNTITVSDSYNTTSITLTNTDRYMFNVGNLIYTRDNSVLDLSGLNRITSTKKPVWKTLRKEVKVPEILKWL